MQPPSTSSPKLGLCPSLSLKPSHFLFLFQCSVHGLALLALALTDLAWFAVAAVSALVIISFRQTLKTRNRLAVSGVMLKGDGSWSIRSPEGKEESATLLGSSLSYYWFVLLQFQTAKAHKSVLICRDSLSSEDFRRLRISLKVLSLQKLET